MQATRFKKAMAGLAVAAGAIVMATGTAGAVVRPGGTAAPSPQGNSQGPAFTGPTPDLATVANNISYRAKSVATFVSAPAGLALDEPVTISVGYGNGARITQTYEASTGNRIGYDYPEGDGHAHQQFISITLTENDPEGGPDYSLNIQWQPMIEPLYDVTVSPLRFDLLTDCAFFGNSDLILDWRDVSGSWHGSWFSLSAGQEVIIPEFGSTSTGVAASSSLYQPVVGGLYDQPHAWYDPREQFYPGSTPVPKVKLAPGSTQTFGFNVRDTMSDCYGYAQFTETYSLER